jgi:hypothetical protein
LDLKIDPDGSLREGVPHAADGKGTRTYWIEAASPTGMTEGQREAAERAARPSRATRGADYVYGESEQEPAPGPGDVGTEDDGPGLGGGGGGTPPVVPPPPPEPESDPGEPDAGTSRAARRK